MHFSPAGPQLAAAELAKFLLNQSKFLTDAAHIDYRRGRVHMAAGALDWAAERLRASVGLSPNWPPAHVASGEVFQRQGRWHPAAAAYRRGLAIDPLSLKALDGLGQVLVASNDIDAAATLYEEALQVRPGWLPFYGQLHDLYLALAKRQEADSITQRLRALLNSGPRTRNYWSADYNFKGEVYGNKGDLNKAIKMYKRALEIDDQNSGTWSNFGETLSKTGQDGRAEEAFLRSIALDPELPQPYNNLGNIYSKRRYWEQAINVYRSALERSDYKVPTLSNLADTYLDMGEWERARQTFERALALAPGNAVLHHHMGQVERGAGQAAKSHSGAAPRRAA